MIKYWGKRCLNMIHKFVRFFSNRKKKRILKNVNLSIFAPNCIGGMVLHDLGVKFNSPFVNLYMDAKDYLKYLREPEMYNKMEFKQIETDRSYPVGKLGDLTVYFVHYKSFDEAVDAFRRRCQRINYENLFVIFLERDGCTYEDLKEFDVLPYKNKVVFTHLPYEEIESSVYIPGFETDSCLGYVLDWDKRLGKRIYDKFDFVGWFDRANPELIRNPEIK